MGIRHAKPHTLRGVVFDETRADVRLGNVEVRCAIKTSALNWNITMRSMMRKGKGNQGLHASEKPLISSEHDPCMPEDKRGRVVEFEDAPNKDEMMVERESKGRRPSERRAGDNENHRVNLPSLLVAHLERNENGQ
ncbi:hypothetical protein Tco_0742660 [Tanacetum coccineum]